MWARYAATVGGFTVPVGGTTFSNLLSDYESVSAGGGNDLNGATVMRIRGRFAALQTGAAVNGQLTLGIAMVNNTAALATPANWAPNTAGRYGQWMFRDYVFFAASGTSPIGGQSTFTQIDVRAKRRIDELQQTLGLFCEGVGTNPIQVFISLDILLALP